MKAHKLIVREMKTKIAIAGEGGADERPSRQALSPGAARLKGALDESN
jgi:hypothetical protein